MKNEVHRRWYRRQGFVAGALVWGALALSLALSSTLSATPITPGAKLKLVRTLELPAGSAVGVAWHRGQLWTVGTDGMMRQIDPITGATLQSVATGLSTHNGLGSDGTTLYMSYDPGGRTLFKRVLPDGNPILTPTDGARDLTAQGGDLWYADFDEGKIVKVSTTGGLLQQFSSPFGFGASGIEWDGTHLLHTRHDGHVLELLNPDDGSSSGQVDISALGITGLGGLAWDGQQLLGVDGTHVYTLAVDSESPLLVWHSRAANPSPSPRSDFGLAWDEAAGVAVLFGGGSHGEVWQQFDDTWVWQDGRWSLKSPATKPAPRRTHGMAYDRGRNRTVVYGGTLDPYGFISSHETWEWDGGNWLQKHTLHSPTAGDHVEMAFDEARGRIVLFGGYDRTQGAQSATWLYDGTDWQKVEPPQSPSPRYYHAMTYDPKRQRVVMFGGASPDRGQLNDLWEWDGMTWNQVDRAVQPRARVLHQFVYLARYGGCVLFGGAAGESEYLNDSWLWSGTDWAQLETPVAPTERAAHGMASSTTGGPVVLFGGYNVQAGPDPSDFRGDTWITPSVTITRPNQADRLALGATFRIEWTAPGIAQPVWKFALNKAAVHQFMLSVAPVADGNGRWHADWVLPTNLESRCDYDLWVKDDSTGVDGHSAPLCIGIPLTMKLAVTWPAVSAADGCVLEAADTIPGSWQAVQALVTVVGDERGVILPVSERNRFYRLRKP